MNNKIKSIKEKLPQIATLPDGYYSGIWGGHIIEVNYKGKIFELETENGVRGFGYNVVVHVERGTATFDDLNN